jgi:peptide/nickel transport system permease protein
VSGLPGREVGRDPLMVCAAATAAATVAVAVLAPWLAPYPGDGGTGTHPDAVMLAPCAAHLLGTDEVGRDVLSRLLLGARTSLGIAAAVLVLACAAGIPLGVVAGYARGLPRTLILRATDVALAFPSLLGALALASVLGPGAGSVVLAVSAVWWPWYARLAYSRSASVSRSGFVTASRALGVSAPRTVLRHVLPHCLGPVGVQVFLDAGGVVLTVAALSYLGLGVGEPACEWGLAIAAGQEVLPVAWWVAVPPGVALLLVAVSFTLVGDGLRSGEGGGRARSPRRDDR